ncbi:FAEL256C-Ap [Eremothecium gossypii FDAG1]|nr:FAEL256C-Ap [Eremothecium gossypii FDAG1]
MSSLEAQLEDRRQRLILLKEKYGSTVEHPIDGTIKRRTPATGADNEIPGSLEDDTDAGDGARRTGGVKYENVTVRSLAHSFEREILAKHGEMNDYNPDEDPRSREKQLGNRVVRAHRRSIQPALDELQQSTDRTLKRIVRKRYFQDAGKDSHEGDSYNEGNDESSGYDRSS